MYSEKTLRRKAKAAGYRIEKGFQHYTVSGAIFTNIYGEHFTGYMVYDMARGEYVWDSFDELFTHRWTLEDVEDFLKGVYKENGLSW